MARHSKWHKVKQFKGAIDAKRSASFTKLARVITVEAREKGADPDMNAGLRAAIARARDASMPKDAIERAIQKGAGGGAEGQIESLTYEAYAPGGIALIIESLTDNRNRTVAEMKHVLSKAGGSLVKTGSVTYLFDRVMGEEGFEWVPKMLIEVDEEIGTKTAELIELLEEHDDVKRVYSNLA
ncbi:YebC/PmpR family DNA-binding transcriptional regulator [Candidatus Uhrbacteria bacterium]|nr:YebC/PmpR family DNA-binding transcriptional regulator [Candidatus Uhrbacteria bacterium]